MFNYIFTTGVILISAALACFVYLESGQDTAAVLWAVYAFGGLFLPGFFTAFPGYEARRDSSGLETRVPRGKKLSRLQASIILAWIIGVGLLLTYLLQIKAIL